MKTVINNLKDQIQHFENQLPALSETDIEMMNKKIKEYKEAVNTLEISTLNIPQRHYKATYHRGAINPHTSIVDFAEKFIEETKEVKEEYEKLLKGEPNNLIHELNDLKAVINNYQIHNDIDPIVTMLENIEYQLNRTN